MVLLPAVPLLVIIAAFVVLGMAVTARASGSAFSGWLSGLGRVARIVVGVPAEIAVALARWITNQVGAEWSDLERLAVTWLAGVQQWAEKVIGGALVWPYTLVRVFDWIVDVELPRLLRAIPHAASVVVHSVTTRVVHIERTVTRLPRLSAALARALVASAVATYVAPYLYQLRWLRAHFHALTAVLPHAIPLQWGRTVTGIRKRLRRLELITAGGVAVGAIAVALQRLGLGWVRCSNVAKAGKALCRADAKWLENLLLGTLAIFGTISLRTFAVEVYALTDAGVNDVLRFWRANVAGTPPNPGLGDIGGTLVALRPADYKRPNPGLGEAA